MTDPYSILGVGRGTSAEECKLAFRQLAKTCHPDLHPNDAQAEARFKEINAAYDAIVNPPSEQQAQFHPGNPFNFHFNFDPGNIHGGRSPFDDLFGHMRAQQQRNELVYEARLSLEEVFTGKEISLQIPAQQQGGSAREFKVRVPAGVDDGMRLVVQQGGTQTQPGIRPNDLHIVIRINPHPRFTRLGMNLSTTVPVTAFDVLLGNELEVLCIDGHMMRVAIPSGFDSTRKLRLAGQGMADAHGARGDLLVELFIHYPLIPEHQQAALREIAEAATLHSPP
jgi:DnaJ-class molecular chaperone